MLGVYPRRLPEYDQARQKWEKQIGWYIVSQMQAQASKMKFKEIEGKIEVTPQQPLRMETILNGAFVNWKGMRANDSGVIITQFISALDTLTADQIIGRYECVDGASDGSDLPVRGRLAIMLKRKYMIYPGPDMVEHLRAKSTAREKGQAQRRGSAGRQAPVAPDRNAGK